MARRDESEDVKRSLKAATLGGLTLLPSTLAMTFAPKITGIPGLAKPYVSPSEMEALKASMGVETPIELKQVGAPYFSRYVSVPVIPGEKATRISLPAVAHELGHAKGGLLQRITGALGGLFTSPAGSFKLGKRDVLYKLPQLSPLHIPLALAAAAPRKEDGKGVVDWIQRHPALLAAALSAGPMAGEVHASARALAAVKKMHGTKAMMRSMGPLLGQLGSHAISHAPAILAIGAISKIRDILQRRGHEKRAAGTIRAVDRPLGVGNPPATIVRSDADAPNWLALRKNRGAGRPEPDPKTV